MSRPEIHVCRLLPNYFGPCDRPRLQKDGKRLNSTPVERLYETSWKWQPDFLNFFNAWFIDLYDADDNPSDLFSFNPTCNNERNKFNTLGSLAPLPPLPLLSFFLPLKVAPLKQLLGSAVISNGNRIWCIGLKMWHLWWQQLLLIINWPQCMHK